MMEIAKIAVGFTTGCCLSRQRIPAGIVGATVSVSFTDPVWDDLEKTVVFRCDESRIAEFDGEPAVVPWEVVTQPGIRLHFGIWGHNPKTGLQLPLIEIPIGITEKATDPQAAPGVDPGLPIWAELEERMISLEENLDTQVESSVKEYLEKNPPSGDGMESLYTEVNETHEGTIDDAIPYNGNMTLENGKYYTQDEIIYHCYWDTGIPVYNPLAELVGIYVEEV